MYGNSMYEEVQEKYESWGDKELKNELGECIKSISLHNAIASACIPIMIIFVALFVSLVDILANEVARTGSSYDFFWIVENGWHITFGIIIVLLMIGFWAGLRLMGQGLKKRVIDDILKARDEDTRYSRWQAVIQGQVLHVDIPMHSN